jgi:hypothetical protein
MDGIDVTKLNRRKQVGECQCCAWQNDQNGILKTLDCLRWRRLDKETAPFPNKIIFDEKD